MQLFQKQLRIRLINDNFKMIFSFIRALKVNISLELKKNKKFNRYSIPNKPNYLYVFCESLPDSAGSTWEDEVPVVWDTKTPAVQRTTTPVVKTSALDCTSLENK